MLCFLGSLPRVLCLRTPPASKLRNVNPFSPLLLQDPTFASHIFPWALILSLLKHTLGRNWVLVDPNEPNLIGASFPHRRKRCISHRHDQAKDSAHPSSLGGGGGHRHLPAAPPGKELGKDLGGRTPPPSAVRLLEAANRARRHIGLSGNACDFHGSASADRAEQGPGEVWRKRKEAKRSGGREEGSERATAGRSVSRAMGPVRSCLVGEKATLWASQSVLNRARRAFPRG